jgi:hypothetical protein
VTTALAKKNTRAPAERAIGRLDSMISLFRATAVIMSHRMPPRA